MLIIFIGAFIAVIAKLFYLQVLHPVTSTSNLYLTTQKITPERGRIYDRFGLPLVLNKPSNLVYIEPKKISNKFELVEKMHGLLALDEATIEAKIDESKDWIAIKNGVDLETKRKIAALNIAGVGFQEEFKRYYPEASLAAHILGFVGKSSDGSDIGYFGIEGYYDKDLTGLSGFLKSERDYLGRPIFLGTQEKVDPENGRALYLTIDKSIQELVKKRLISGMETYKAKEGCVIVAEPYSGEILALVCLPDFDLEKYYSFSESYFRNPAISDAYEPGSTFKPFIMAAALEERKIKPQDFYNEEGPIKIGEYTIKTWNNQYEGKINMTRILEKSSNVGMVYIGKKLGSSKLYDYLRRYGFGQPTGVDLQGELGGSLKQKSAWYDIDYATATFGQGIAVTPLQMIRAFASLINGGQLMKPFIVKKMKSEYRQNTIEPVIIDRVISNRTSEIIKKMLVSTVENGEFKWAVPEGYQIGGKTGTAQIPIAGHYDPSKTVASFIGFAPASKPKFIAIVILKEPQTSPWGSETAAPLFFEIAKEILVYYNIAPQ